MLPKKKTFYLVIVTLALLIWAASTYAEDRHAATFGIGVGHGNSEDYITQEIGYERLYEGHNASWALNYERMRGKGRPTANHYSAVWKVHTKRRGFFGTPFVGAGIGYTDDYLGQKGTVDDIGEFGPVGGEKPLVSEKWTFKLQLGTSWYPGDNMRVDLALDHDSTGGGSDRNRGIDRAKLRFSLKV